MLRGWVVALGVCLWIGVLGASMAGCKGGGGGGSGGNGAMDGSPGDGNKDGSGNEKPDACNPAAAHGNSSLGQTCSCDTDCGSGFCADGVCCNTSCGDTCHACNLPGSEGSCELLPAGVKPRMASQCTAEPESSCGRDGTCDGKGGCRTHVRGTMCFSGTCDGDGIAGVKICDGKGNCGPGPAVSCAPYACAGDKCPSSCTTDGDCSAGHQCVGKSCGTLPNGRACKVNDDCSSSNCVDGVCCNVPCDGECVSCNQPDAVGQCRPLGEGLPDDKCPAKNKSTCGTTGLCDGFGACSLFPADSTCIPPSCSGSMLNTAGTCDGLGTCQQPGQIECAPFACSKDACVKDCTSDTDCVAPNTCMNRSCGKKPMGSPCAGGSQCLSNQCVDGVCCDSACTGACQSCALQSSLGHCTNVAKGASDPHGQCKDQGAASCGTDSKCDGNGACRKYPVDMVCGQETCVGGAYTPPSTCNASGQCIPPGGQSCFPYACNGSKCFTSCTQTAGQCGGTNSCVNGSCGLKPAGAACSASNECQFAQDGKQYCSQGVCCNGPCTNACQACNLAGSTGTCTSVSQNVVDPQHKCATTPQAMCGTNGKCRAGGCDVYHTTDQCAPVGCASSNTQYVAAFCSGTGAACPGRVVVPCGVYTCDNATGTCRNRCGSNADCVSPNTCINNSCGLKSNGAACTAGTECGSGICTEGVCCNNACSGAAAGLCQSCKVTGSVGTCKPVPLGGSDPQLRCVKGSTTCGLDGMCDGTGKCHYPDTSVNCSLQSCTGSVQTNPANCDGKGACSAPSTKNCDPFACNVASATCRNTCTSNAECNAPVTCNTQTNKCGDKLPAGSTCSLDTDCAAASPFCAKEPGATTGKCCNSACTGGCQSCSLTGSSGTCTSLPAGNPPRIATMCTAAPPCGNTGTCNGSGACSQTAGGTQCRAPMCATTKSELAAASCPGGGAACPAMVTTPCAPGYLCTGTACATSCTGTGAGSCDTDGGYVCSAGKCLKPSGGTCTANTECVSGACVSSSAGGGKICCGTACPADTSAGMCGNTGTCSATTFACVQAPVTKSCAAAMCTGTVLTSIRNCNGSGQCAPATTTDCAPYSCSTGGCNNPCSATKPCADGYNCSGGMCVALANDGQSCMGNADCLNNHCAGGVCCATACPAGNDCVSTACKANGSGCAPVAKDVSCGRGSSCSVDLASGTNDVCDGKGTCDKVDFTCALPDEMCSATPAPASCVAVVPPVLGR